MVTTPQSLLMTIWENQETLSESEVFFRKQKNRGKSGLNQRSHCSSIDAGIFYIVLSELV